MKYPSRSEYCSAIRNPGFAFRKKDPTTQLERDLDPELAAGRVVERVRANGMQEVWSASGGFAIAFKYETPSQGLWAVRCFYRRGFEATQHYQKITSNLEKNPACRSHFVSCKFLQEGIRVMGSCYPVVKMKWVEGENLKRFIKRNLDCREKLQKLADKWQELSRNLQKGSLAHGDLQHGNILVVERRNDLELKLIDYDSLYFERDGNSIDDRVKGLPDYQHPLRESLKKQCLAIDFFPQLVIYTSILALSLEPSLWNTYNLDMREGLLFSKSDFQNPTGAAVFSALSKLPQPLPALARSIRDICSCSSFAQIPALETVLETIQTANSGFTSRLFAKKRSSPAKKQQQQSESFLSRFIGRGNFSNFGLPKLKTLELIKPKPPQPKPSPKPEPPKTEPKKIEVKQKLPVPQKAPQIERDRQPDRQIPVKSLAKVEPTWQQNLATPGTPVGRTDTNGSGSADAKLLWDPRAHKKAATPSGSQPAPAAPKPPAPQPQKQEDRVPGPEALQVESDKKGSDNVSAWIAQTEKTVTEAYSAVTDAYSTVTDAYSTVTDTYSTLKSTLKQNVAQLLTPKTWPTSDVAKLIDRPPAWCHRQRYKYPSKFRLGQQYLKDAEGMIYWTRFGIRQLRSLKQKENAIPPSLLPTKAVGTLLSIPPEHVTRLKSKYQDEFVEGTHYFIDRQKRYHWTAEGVERLRSRLALQKPASPAPSKTPAKKKRKTKSRSRKLS